MNKIIYLLLFMLTSLTFITTTVLATGLCYKANKNEFKQTPGTAHDIIFNLSDLKKNQNIYISFLSLLPIPYADSTYDFYCMLKKNRTNSYECVGDDDGGKMHIRIEDWNLYVNVEYARMANTTDDPIIHKIESKKNKFTSARRTVCPKPHIFKNQQEKHLPYVCYNRKEKEHVGGSNKTIYTGCTRHNQTCKSIEAKHFGKYPNDHEADKAFQRCINSKPNLIPDTYLPLKSKVSAKNKKKKMSLLRSITIKDVTIYDLDYYNDLVIAVGEDASTETRKLQSMDEYHESVMLKSTDSGKHWRKIGKEDASSVPHDTVIVLDNKRILVASSIEGAGGSIILSEDAGNSWETRYSYAFIESMKHIKGNTIVAKTFGPDIKSIDGGRNWVEISSQ